MQLPRTFALDRTFTQPVVWLTILVMIAFHIGALAALFVFNWKTFLSRWFCGGLRIEGIRLTSRWSTL